jgi:hypothetical protein
LLERPGTRVLLSSGAAAIRCRGCRRLCSTDREIFDAGQSAFDPDESRGRRLSDAGEDIAEVIARATRAGDGDSCCEECFREAGAESRGARQEWVQLSRGAGCSAAPGAVCFDSWESKRNSRFSMPVAQAEI